MVKVRQDKRVINKTIHLALGINLSGKTELLALWLAESEVAKYRLWLLTELQNRSLKEIFIDTVDGLTGFPDAIEAAYPQTRVQPCIVHMVRHSLRFVSWKDRKAMASDLKKICTSATVEKAEREFSAFAGRWDAQYSATSQSRRRDGLSLIILFDYPADIRKVIATTNALESVNSVIRKAVNNRKLFPSNASATTVVFLAIEAASRKWIMPIRNWKTALNRSMIELPDRIPETL